MSASSLHRALAVVVLLGILLAACQGKSIAGPGLGDSAAVDIPVGAVEHISGPCGAGDLTPPCGDGGECLPPDGTIIAGPPYVMPELSWTYGCIPDKFEFYLERPIISTPNPNYPDLPIPWSSLPGTTLSYTPPGSLTPGDYTWLVRAVKYSELWGDPVNNPELNSYGDASRTRFWVGSMCQSADQIIVPDYGEPDYIINIAGNAGVVDFSWYFTDVEPPCLPDRFEGEIAEDLQFTVNVMSIVTGQGLHTWGKSEAPLQRCHTYYWHVRGMLNDQPGSWSYTWHFRIATEEDCQSPAYMKGAFEAAAIQDSTCRHGPGTAYGIAAYAAAGERRMIVGRNADGTWFLTADGCYINSRLLRVEVVQGTPFPEGADVGSLMSLIPEVPDPPLPTETTAADGPSGPACTPYLKGQACLDAGGKPVFGAGPISCNCTP